MNVWSVRKSAVVGFLVVALIGTENWSSAETKEVGHWLYARTIATGIPGAGAVTEVGDFLRGSPIHDKAAFTVFAQSGHVLDPKRILVASTSNFGAPLARANEPEGSILSIDPMSNGLSVPQDFAAAGGQASALGGLVQVYAAQSPSFLNQLNNPLAVTAGLPSASLPLGISLNNGNGRPWIANAPNGASGYGTITVLDPQGYPLAGAPDPIAGGVFADYLTNRNPKWTGGLTSAALSTAILTKSPDLTGRAVFAAVEADGSVVQVNVLKGVDPLASAGTVTPVERVDRSAAESLDPSINLRRGMVFNWVPNQALFIADPGRNRLVVLDIADNGTIFSSTRREIRAEAFDHPIDIAPTTREISHGSFASNTTLSGGSDLFVLNRGNNSIVRLSVYGELLGVRKIHSDLPSFRANGIAVSSDGQTIYVTAILPNGSGALLAMPSFGGNGTSAQFLSQAAQSGMASDMNTFSKFLFSLEVKPAQGLGPLFNDQSCAGCHSSPTPGGMGLLHGQDVQLVGRIKSNGVFDDLEGRGGPVARVHSVVELGVSCGVAPGIPHLANVVALRNSMSLRGAGQLDTISAGDIMANMAAEPDSVRGRLNILPDGRIGKFGWKANVPTLIEFMGDAFRNELGLTNPLKPRDEVTVEGCKGDSERPEIDALPLEVAAKFLNTIDPPAPAATCLASKGAVIFQAIGCAGCHTPSLPGPGARQSLSLFSDLLLHDMGASLDDQIQQGSAKGNEWRTPPLWRVSERGKFLHDGRAATITDAIQAHGGQAQASKNAFQALDSAAKQDLLNYLGCI